MVIHRKQIKTALGMLMVLMICFVDMMWGASFIYRWKADGTVISVRNASTDLPGIFLQNLILFIVPLILFVAMLFILRKDFADEMYLRVTGKKQAVILLILGGILLLLTVFCMVTKEDKISVLYSMVYYLVFIAFAEEFVVRDVCVYLLRNERKVIQYVVPNLIFAFMHVFAYAGWGSVTVTDMAHFVTSDLFGLIAVGCLFQFLKEKSNTIWIPVLVHAIMDDLAVFGYR